MTRTGLKTLSHHRGSLGGGIEPPGMSFLLSPLKKHRAIGENGAEGRDRAPRAKGKLLGLMMKHHERGEGGVETGDAKGDATMRGKWRRRSRHRCEQ